MYHGLRLFSLFAINRLIGQLIEEAADRDAIRAARRFALHYREYIYRAATSHHRVLQLADTFPLAALAACADFYGAHDRPDLDRTGFEAWQADRKARAATAVRLTKRGASLREVAAALEIPMALRRVKPGVAHLVTPFLVQHPDLLQWMPNETPAARIWLTSVGFAGHRDVDFGRWVARHVSEIPGDFSRSATRSAMYGIGSTPTPREAGDSSSRAVSPRRWRSGQQSRQATNGTRPSPATWMMQVISPCRRLGFRRQRKARFDIVPLTTSADLYREGHAMHHCVATYVDQVRQGNSTSFRFVATASGSRRFP